MFVSSLTLSRPAIKYLNISGKDRKNNQYFSILILRTPTRIGDHLYIDGGVGGNCPLAQAIPRMRELSKVGHPNSVLSISPPRFVVGELKESCIFC